MKILMMVWQFPPASRGGAEMQCWKQARALAARGHEVTILTGWPWLRLPRREITDGVTIRRIGFFLPVTMQIRRLHRWLHLRVAPPAANTPDPFSADGPRSGTPSPRKRFRWMAPVEWMGYASFLLEVAVWSRRSANRVDVVHVHESHWLAGVAHWVAERMEAPVLCKEAFADVLQWPGARDVPGLARWKIRRDRCRFVAIAPHVRQALESAGIPPERIVDIPNGVEMPEETARPEASTRAVYAGNFSQGAVFKAFDVLLTACARACREAPELTLRLFGGGSVERWRLFAEVEGCGSAVEFAGRTDDLPREFRAVGFLVLPSRTEGLSNVLLEAMASGLPAVVSDIPGNTAAVRDGVEGLVVPVGDADALARAMVRLIRDSDLRVRLGQAARQRAEEVFSIDRVAEQLEQAYRAALSGV